MANSIRLKRKLTTGAPDIGQMAVGEPVYNVIDRVLYIKRDTINLDSIFLGGAFGDMLKSVYDANDDGKVDEADLADLALNANSLGTVPAAQYALKSYVDASISALVNGAGTALDTLNELAAALGNDPNFATTITTSLAGKLDANSIIDGGTI